MRKIVVLLFFSAAFYTGNAQAWGWDGHKLICAVAYQKLTSEASKMVDQLLKDGAELKGGVVSFPESCLWPDDVRYSTRKDTYEHHFLNVPDDANTIDLSRDCEAVNCIAVGIQRALVYLTREPSGNREITRRAAALRYLAHYVADLHQPLHISNGSDWGGNRITVDWYGKETNIHAVWDYELFNRIGITHPDSTQFIASIKVNNPGGSMLDWMNESLSIARSHGYADHRGQKISIGATLGDDYLNYIKPVALERMALSAERLADLLNQIAAGQTPTAFSLGIAD